MLEVKQITKSIKNTISETERRREKQIEYNKKNNIQPKSVKKEIKDIMEAPNDVQKDKKYISDEFLNEYKHITPDLALKKIKKLEDKMYKEAENLEFEQAASTRDEINKIKGVGDEPQPL